MRIIVLLNSNLYHEQGSTITFRSLDTSETVRLPRKWGFSKLSLARFGSTVTNMVEPQHSVAWIHQKPFIYQF